MVAAAVFENLSEVGDTYRANDVTIIVVIIALAIQKLRGVYEVPSNKRRVTKNMKKHSRPIEKVLRGRNIEA